MRKPHASSRLKTLPADKQKAVYEYLAGHTLEETEAWLAADGVETSRTPLSEFFAWYPLSVRLRTASDMGNAVTEILRELPSLHLDEQQLSLAGQAIFEAQALQAQDSELFISLRKLRQEDLKGAQKARQIQQKDKEISLALEKFQIEAAEKMLSAAMRARADEINASGMSNADKIAAMRAAAFAEIDELQASGRVVIPK